MKKRMTLQDKAEKALTQAVKEVVEQHKKSKRPLVIWKKGKTTLVQADRIR